LNLLVATLGVVLLTGFLLNVVLQPLSQPLISHSQLFSVAKGPYYPLPVILAVVLGYISYTRLKGNQRFWVWVVPALYLAAKIVVWKNRSVLRDDGWGATMAHFFAPKPPYHPEEDVVVPFYTSIAYAFGALLERSGVFRFEHSENTQPPPSERQD